MAIGSNANNYYYLPNRMKEQYQSPFNITVLVAGMGFFIDVFDLFLFNVYRIPSLRELGLEGQELTRKGEFLLSIQMAGMMLGGILTGIIGDKKGRVKALYASIVLYSIANIANSFVTDINTYALVRFLAGVGLAGEMGSGITLVAESMTVEKRGYGTIMVATMGALGAIAAGLSADWLPWRTAFFVAGLAGFLLLRLRIASMESSIFHSALQSENAKGSLLLLISSKKRLTKYLACILVGIPIWYSVGLLITLSPEIAALKNISGLKLSVCFILFQAGVAAGDLSSGIISQWLKTRKWTIFGFMLFGIAATIYHFYRIESSGSLELSSLLIGLGCGYLSVFVTSTAEHFGTNLRVTVTATVTNFMRGAVTILIPLHIWIENTWNLDLTKGLMIIGIMVWLLALAAILYLPETYGKQLSFEES
jgi:putative MFS transporter